MIGCYGFCILILAFVSKSSGGTIERTSDTEGHHHHHHHHNQQDFCPNHDEAANYQNYFSTDQRDNDDSFDDDFDDQLPEGPKTTSRRDIAVDVVPEYPYDDIRKLLDTNPLLKEYFKKIISIGNRHSATEEEDAASFCKTKTVRIYNPQRLLNINNIERFIVNDKGEYVQAVEEKRCANDGGACDIPFDVFGYTTYCHQSFDIKRLMVYENSTKKLVFDEFRVPSCCLCKVKKLN